MYVVRILQTFTLDAQKYVMFAEHNPLKPLMDDELRSEVCTNLLHSVLDIAGGVYTVVQHTTISGFNLKKFLLMSCFCRALKIFSTDVLFL